MKIGLTHIKSTVAMSPPIAQRLGPEWLWLGVPPIEYSGYAFRNSSTGILVITSVDTMDDGSRVWHVTCSYADHLPSWEDLKTIKNLFIGPEVDALQLLPKESDYINLMPYCLHLWAEYEG